MRFPDILLKQFKGILNPVIIILFETLEYLNMFSGLESI